MLIGMVLCSLLALALKGITWWWGILQAHRHPYFTGCGVSSLLPPTFRWASLAALSRARNPTFSWYVPLVDPSLFLLFSIFFFIGFCVVFLFFVFVDLFGVIGFVCLFWCFGVVIFKI